MWNNCYFLRSGFRHISPIISRYFHSVICFIPSLKYYLAWIIEILSYIKIVRRQMRFVGQIIEDVSSHFLWQVYFPGSCMELWVVIVQKDNSFGQSSSSFVFDRSPKIYDGFAIKFRIYYGAPDVKNSFSSIPFWSQWRLQFLFASKLFVWTFSIFFLWVRIHPLLRSFLCFWIHERIVPVTISSQNTSLSSS